MYELWGGQNYYVYNVVRMTHLNPVGWGSYPYVSEDAAQVLIPGVFKKELTKEYEGGTAKYRITVNEAKADLTGGKELIIHDVMTNTLAYINGSLLITAEDVNGNITRLVENVDYTVRYDSTHINNKGENAHLLEIKITSAQPVKYILDYDTTLIFTESTDGENNVKYSNSAIVYLWGDKITSDTEEKVVAGVNIKARNYRVTITKKEAGTDNTTLKGAVFGLFSENGSLIAIRETDENGQLEFATKVSDGIILREHTLYYIQELRAPNGYVLDDTKHWFVFCMGATLDNCDFKADVDFAYKRIPTENVFYGDIYNSTYGYELPETGGAGTQQYTTGGLLVIITATALLLYRTKRYRKEDTTSS